IVPRRGSLSLRVVRNRAKCTGVGESPACLQCIDIGEGFVRADSHDAREAERVAAFMTLARLNRIERHFNNDLRNDTPPTSLLLDGGGEKMLREMRDLRIGEAGVGFADGEEPIVFIVA